jgi:hypothetical protein
VLLSYVHDLHPADSVEMDHVVDMVNAKWQQRRLNNSETAMFERKMVDQKEELDKVYDFYDKTHAHAFAFQDLSESGSLQTLHRALSRVERNYSHALNNLLRLRKLPKSNPEASSGRAATVRESVVREPSPIQENEKRPESQHRTPTADRQSPTEAQHESDLQPPQPSVASTLPGSSDPAAETQ